MKSKRYLILNGHIVVIDKINMAFVEYGRDGGGTLSITTDNQDVIEYTTSAEYIREQWEKLISLLDGEYN